MIIIFIAGLFLGINIQETKKHQACQDNTIRSEQVCKTLGLIRR
jgi:hypothetical protein